MRNHLDGNLMVLDLNFYDNNNSDNNDNNDGIDNDNEIDDDNNTLK